MKKLLLALVGMAYGVSSFAADTSVTDLSTAELTKLVQEQQKQLDTLQTQLKNTDTKLNAAADAVDASAGENGNGKTYVGGYGELHLNQLRNRLDGGKDLKEIDFHRFVLLLGHQFSDKVRVFSEFELEHSLAGEGKKGEVELEQAYVEWDYLAGHSVRSGVFLIPVGILNETHEPDTFYGVERNSVEKNVLPTTWWEGGVNFKGEIAEGWSYDLAVHSGLHLTAGKSKVRDGRQKVSNAPAEDFAYTGRVKYNGIAGLEVAATLQIQEDMWQGLGATTLGATLLETHVVYNVERFGLRALYAKWDLDDGINAVAAGASEQSGWYVEPSYRFTDKVGVFVSYGEWDNQAAGTADTEYGEWTIGSNYWLTDTTVFKADIYVQESPENKDELEGFNLGVGYSF